MLIALSVIEDFLLGLCEQEDFIIKHPEIVEITRKYQDFLGSLYDSGIVG